MEKLESSQDTVMSAERHIGIPHYPTPLVLNPVMLQSILTKRSKAYLAKGLWVQALSDATKVRCFVSVC